jgi:hypothetical protein
MKRYDLETVGPPYLQYETMVERPDGDWVLWEDVEPLMQKFIRMCVKGPEYRTELQDFVKELQRSKS